MNEMFFITKIIQVETRKWLFFFSHLKHRRSYTDRTRPSMESPFHSFRFIALRIHVCKEAHAHVQKILIFFLIFYYLSLEIKY